MLPAGRSHNADQARDRWLSAVGSAHSTPSVSSLTGPGSRSDERHAPSRPPTPYGPPRRGGSMIPRILLLGIGTDKTIQTIAYRGRNRRPREIKSEVTDV